MYTMLMVSARSGQRKDTHSLELDLPRQCYCGAQNFNLARHCRPPPAIVTRLHVLVMDFVWSPRDGKRIRPWVPAAVKCITDTER